VTRELFKEIDQLVEDTIFIILIMFLVIGLVFQNMCDGSCKSRLVQRQFYPQTSRYVCLELGCQKRFIPVPEIE